MISMRIYEKGNFHATSSAVILLVSFLVIQLVGRASGAYASNVRENFASRSLDGNANGLCKGPNCAEGDEVSGAMWFGPRLGRRRRSDERAATFDQDDINTIADVLQAAPWSLVSVQGAKRQATNQYIPRMGRESGEELLQKLLMGDNARLGRLFENDELMEEREVPTPSAPPTPRLGRNLPFTPSPRLGRRLRALLQKL